MSKAIDRQNIGAILFDLGNVLIDIDFYRCARIWSDHAGIPAETLAARFRIDDAYRALECGKIEASTYYDALRRQLGITLPDDIMREGWNAIIGDEKPGIRDCLRQLTNRYRLYVLTNTNPDHEIIWARKHRELLSHFKSIFISSRMGCRKPDAQVYLKVSQSIGVPCSRILFFDDAEENIEGARRAGMQAIQADHAHTISQWIPTLIDIPET
ncbi:MAG: HAD family phosphatase [Deltaproteobacteria bacterium]|nr:HAD family phosphatase [Deltaproteobacteria bacterium]